MTNCTNLAFYIITHCHVRKIIMWRHGGLMVRAQMVWVRALAMDIVLCSWARHFTLRVPLFTQVYTDEFNAGSDPSMDQNPIQVEQTSYYRNLENLWPDRPLGSYANFTLDLHSSSNCAKDCQGTSEGCFVIISCTIIFVAYQSSESNKSAPWNVLHNRGNRLIVQFRIRHDR